MPLAQLNIGVLTAPLESPQMAEFVAQLAEVNAAAERFDGFIWRLKDEDEAGPGSTSYRMFDDDMTIVNMSVWRDLQSLRAFVIEHAGHRVALSRRREWFDRPTEAMTVCWFVADGHEPTLDEAGTMLRRLRSEGPSGELFPFTYRD